MIGQVPMPDGRPAWRCWACGAEWQIPPHRDASEYQDAEREWQQAHKGCNAMEHQMETPTMQEAKLLETADAMVWTMQFLESCKETPGIATDAGTMLGWFANAIMAGYDAAVRNVSLVDITKRIEHECDEIGGVALRVASLHIALSHEISGQLSGSCRELRACVERLRQR